MSYLIPKKQEIRNEMMERPVVQEELVQWLRTAQKPMPTFLAEIEAYANERRIPIIPHETAVYLDFLLGVIKPSAVLEIGAAIGFSALLMAQHLAPGGHLTTIDRFDVMIERAKANFARSPYAEQISLVEGDAADVLPTLPADHYDLIFMDSAKSKYAAFLPECLRVLKTHGILIVDDILQGGTVLADESQIPKRVKKIHRELKKFLHTVMTHPQLKSTILPLGDGLIMIEKLHDQVELTMN